MFMVWVVAVAVTIVNLLDTRRLSATTPPSRFPMVSVVIPARNEAAAIKETIRRLLCQTYPHLEVIVVDDRSNDGTGELARHAADADARLLVVDGEELPNDWLGKPWAMEQGARRARGELILFVDADVSYEPDAIMAMVAFREQMNADLVSFLPHLEMKGFWEQVLMPQLACFVFRFMPIFLSNRSRTPWLAFGGGVGNLMGREIYEANGRHGPVRRAIIDDVGLAQLVRKRGGITRVGRAEHLVSVHMYRGGEDIVAGFTKNAFAVVGSYRWAFVMIAAQLSLHVGPYIVGVIGVVQFLATGAMTSWGSLSIGTVGLITATRVLLFRSLGYRLDNALLGEVPMALGWSYILARSTWYVGVKGQLEWRGRRYAASTRFGEH